MNKIINYVYIFLIFALLFGCSTNTENKTYNVGKDLAAGRYVIKSDDKGTVNILKADKTQVIKPIQFGEEGIKEFTINLYDGHIIETKDIHQVAILSQPDKIIKESYGPGFYYTTRDIEPGKYKVTNESNYDGVLVIERFGTALKEKGKLNFSKEIRKGKSITITLEKGERIENKVISKLKFEKLTK